MIDLDRLKLDYLRASTAAKTPADVLALKNKFFGRTKGLFTRAFNEFSALTLAQKQAIGPKLNQLKRDLEQSVNLLRQKFQNQKGQADLSLPPLADKTTGHLHPLTQTQKKLEEIFKALGFGVVTGPEIESDWYNFTALNFPEFHPARDMQDTFFIKSPTDERLVLRTHTSPNQIRFMEKHKPPFAIVVPGTVYRNEATDAKHEHTIEQLEGLVVGKSINFANMVWTIEQMLKGFFGPGAKTRIAPTYFPFVEPGAEVLMSSPRFQNGNWVELAGCGMVHQNVFENSGYPRNKYQGFAFGFGPIRFPLMKHGIPDIRLLHENDLRFLSQF